MVRSGIVKLDLADIFNPVLGGRKLRLRISYKARLMTEDDATKYLEQHRSYLQQQRNCRGEKEIEEREATFRWATGKEREFVSL